MFITQILDIYRYHELASVKSIKSARNYIVFKFDTDWVNSTFSKIYVYASFWCLFLGRIHLASNRKKTVQAELLWVCASVLLCRRQYLVSIQRFLQHEHGSCGWRTLEKQFMPTATFPLALQFEYSVEEWAAARGDNADEEMVDVEVEGS